MDYTRKECTSLSSALKAAYVKVVLPFEIYLSKQTKPVAETPATTQKREHSSDQPIKEKTSSPPPSKTTVDMFSAETRKSKRIKKDPVSYAGKFYYYFSSWDYNKLQRTLGGLRDIVLF